MLLCCCFSCQTGQAQQIIYDHFGIREGISNRLVSDIIYDKQGLIWVATANGLNRFDGYNFVTFSTTDESAQNQQLSHARIKELALSPDGQIFIFYEDLYSSFDIIDPLTFEIKKIEVALEVDGEPRAIYVDKKGGVHILSKRGHTNTISVFDHTADQFTKVCQITEYWNRPHPNVNLLQTATGKYLVYDIEMGLRIIDPKNNKSTYLPPPSHHSDYNNNAASLSFLHRSKDDKIWLSYTNRNGVFLLDEQNLELQLYAALSTTKQYSDVWEDEVGNLIFNQATRQGNYPSSHQLFCLQTNGKVSDFSYLIDTGHFILSMNGLDFFQTIFIGNDTGLKVVQNSATRVEQYLAHNISMDNRAFSMRGMCSDGKGNIYFAREVSYWYKLDTKNNVLDTIKLYDTDGSYLNFSRCQGILYDSTNYIWGVTGDGSNSDIGLLHQYDLDNCTNKIYRYNKNFSAYALEKSKENIWLGTHSKNGRGALVYFNIQDKKFDIFQDQQGFNPFGNTIIRFILPVGDAILWIGTQDGLFWLNTQSKQWNHYKKDTHPQFPNAQKVNLSDDIIFNLYLDENNILWIGTLNGLTRFDLSTNNWKTYYKDDGLASNTIAYILPSSNHSLWISTYNGLSHFIPDEDQSRQFFSINGLSHNEFNRFSGLLDENNRYYFGGVNGVNAFYAHDLLVNQKIPNVLLTAYTYYDSHLDSIITQYTGLEKNKEIIIEPHISFFSFDFALPIYTPTTDNQFRYKIGQNATEWINLKKGHSLRFNDLKPGSYKVLVQGADSSGNWNSEPYLIKLKVEQAFYNSWWFLFLISIIIIAVAYGLLRYRLEEKLRMERLRTQLASDLHDEVSGLLAGISLQSELLRSQVREEAISLKLSNIRQASQRAMSKMSDVIWSIDSRRDRIADLISRMEEHADEVLLPLNIRYELSTKELTSDSAIPANIRQDLYFIYKESINNVAKHANANFVEIILENAGTHFKMSVKDNGIPKESPTETSKKSKRKGQGLANLKMRAERLNAQLDILPQPSYTILLRMKRFS